MKPFMDKDFLLTNPTAKKLYHEVAARMRVVFQRSNFYNAMHSVYAELGTFGTAFVFELADPHQGFCFMPLCAGEYVLDCNARQRVDTVFRRISMSVRQMEQAFGLAALPEQIRQQARRQPDIRHTVVQAVCPQEACGAGLAPIIIGNSILHVQRHGARVRDLFYSLEKDGYAGNDLSILAPHLFERLPRGRAGRRQPGGGLCGA